MPLHARRGPPVALRTVGRSPGLLLASSHRSSRTTKTTKSDRPRMVARHQGWALLSSGCRPPVGGPDGRRRCGEGVDGGAVGAKGGGADGGTRSRTVQEGVGNRFLLTVVAAAASSKTTPGPPVGVHGCMSSPRGWRPGWWGPRGAPRTCDREWQFLRSAAAACNRVPASRSAVRVAALLVVVWHQRWLVLLWQLQTRLVKRLLGAAVVGQLQRQGSAVPALRLLGRRRSTRSSLRRQRRGRAPGERRLLGLPSRDRRGRPAAAGWPAATVGARRALPAAAGAAVHQALLAAVAVGKNPVGAGVAVPPKHHRTPTGAARGPAVVAAEAVVRPAVAASAVAPRALPQRVHGQVASPHSRTLIWWGAAPSPPCRGLPAAAGPAGVLVGGEAAGASPRVVRGEPRHWAGTARFATAGS